VSSVNGIGVGTAVGLGAIIGLGIVAPRVEVAEYVLTFLVYGMLAGFFFELYHFAVTWKHPFRR